MSDEPKKAEVKSIEYYAELTMDIIASLESKDSNEYGTDLEDLSADVRDILNLKEAVNKLADYYGKKYQESAETLKRILSEEFDCDFLSKVYKIWE